MEGMMEAIGRVGRRVGRLGCLVVCLAALPALALASVPAGKWTGSLKDFAGSKVSFTVKAGGKKLLNFRAHGTYGSLHCYGNIESATVWLPSAQIRGSSVSGKRVYTAQGLKEVDKLSGRFSGKHASGTVDQEFFDSGGTDVCGTGKLKWSARATGQ
jgi:hypothetical protein